MKARRRRPFGCLLVLVAILVLAAVTHALWLPVIGTSLEKAGPPCTAQVAVVLGGDHFGLRILKAAQLARDGSVHKVIVSGPSGEYGFYECDLAIAFAVKRGFPESMFVCMRNDARATRDEARILTSELKKMGVHSYVLVTSDYHTRRAANLFRSAAPDLQLCVVASADQEFQLDRWWLAREGRKQIVMEWSKTVATWFGL